MKFENKILYRLVYICFVIWFRINIYIYDLLYKRYVYKTQLNK